MPRRWRRRAVGVAFAARGKRRLPFIAVNLLHVAMQVGFRSTLLRVLDILVVFLIHLRI